MEEELDALIAKAKEVGVTPFFLDLAKNTDDVDAVKILKEFIKAKRVDEYKEKAEKNERYAAGAIARSIQNIYGKDISMFKQPKIQLNMDAKPSNKGKSRAVTGAVGGSKDAPRMENFVDLVTKRKTVIPKAKICNLPDGLCVPIEDVKIPLTDREGQILSSGMAAKQARLGSNMVYEYANEAEVQNLCYTMVEDALQVLGLHTNDVRPHLEVSIYTMRPDIILVLRREGKIFFTIEVKSPELQNGEVFQNSKVGYQLFSYLLAMHAMGDEAPMAAVMTYDKIALVTLDDYAKKNEQVTEAVEEAKKTFRDGGFNNPAHPEVKNPCKERNNTPVKNIVAYKTLVHSQHKFYSNTSAENEESIPFEMDEPDSDGHHKITPKVYMSKPHSDGHVFPFLLQALLVAYLKGTNAQDRVVAIRENDSLGGRFAFKVAKDAFHWYKLKGCLTATIDHTNFASEKKKEYFILGKLGEGKTGSVHIAVTPSGSVCAMKIYKTKPFHISVAVEEKYVREKTNQLQAEKHLWEKLYSERQFEVLGLWLGGSPCLLMPYGHDLVSPKDDNSADMDDCARWKSLVNHARWKALPEIKKELSRFASNGYAYRSSDLRWNHVLRDPKDMQQVFFCDLESLGSLDENSSTEETAEQAVWSQLAILLRPMVSNVSLEETRKLAGNMKGKGPPETESLSGEDVTDWKRFAGKTLEELTNEEKVLLYSLNYWKGRGETKNKSDSPKSHVTVTESGSPGSRDSSEPSLHSECHAQKAEEPPAKRLKIVPPE